MTSEKSAEDVFFAFSIEPQHDKQTLERYLKSYPQFADELVDLSHELRIAASFGPGGVPLEDEASVQAAWRQYSAIVPPSAATSPAEVMFDRFKGKAFITLAESLKVPRSVLVALRDRLIIPSSIPQGFVRRLARTADVSAETVRQYLSLPPVTSAAMSFKADQKPAAQSQVKFETLLNQSNLTEEQVATLQQDLE